MHIEHSHETLTISPFSFPIHIDPVPQQTKGTLPELIDVIIDEKTSLFVCAVG